MNEVRHGYTLKEIDILVRRGILRNPWYQAVDMDERYATGWHAAVELLYISDEPPSPRDITNTAWRAADKWTGRDAEEHGIPRKREDSHTGRHDLPRFHAYWCSRTVHAVDERIIERTALQQIWPCLRSEYQDALQALAAYGKYAEAAEALGLTYDNFCHRVSKARRCFDEFWYEGETPGPRWKDRRIQTVGGKRDNISTSIRRRKRALEKTSTS